VSEAVCLFWHGMITEGRLKMSSATIGDRRARSLGDLWDACRESSQKQMVSLCASFPTLRGVPGTNPWNQEVFAQWASGPAPSHGIRQAAAFVLSVWNGGTPCDGGWWNSGDFSVGVFDPVEALGTWDRQHAHAFMQWCAKPFWP